MWRLSEPLGYMRTLIFEQWQGGHYFNYLECLVPRVAAISGEVIVADIERSLPSLAGRAKPLMGA